MAESAHRGGGRSTSGLVFALAFKSLLHRRLTAGLTLLSVAASVALLTGVERVRTQAKANFANTIFGADLIVGARGGPLNLLLYSVFRIGDATNNIRWDSYRAIADQPEVEWTIPLSLGDAHRGFRVLGTNADYFAHYRFGPGRGLEFAHGEMFATAADAVLGADVAAALGYRVGDSIVVSHGIGDTSFEHHDDDPFRVVGVLSRTGTPVDRTVHVTLGGVRAMHDDGDDGHNDDDGHDDHASDDGHDGHDDDNNHDGHASDDGHDGHDEHDGHDDDNGHDGHDDDDGHDEHGGDDDHNGHGGDDDHDEHDGDEGHDDHGDHGGHETFEHPPEAITAFIVGLKARPLLLAFQRFVNEYPAEPLLAIAPGVVLGQLWELVSVAEVTLLAVSVLVVVAGLAGLLTMLLASVSERRREMAVLRAAGAGRRLVFALLAAEAAMLTAAGAVLGVACTHVALFAARGAVLDRFGLVLTAQWPGWFEAVVVGMVALAAALAAVLPAWRLYRLSLADGLTVRV